MLMEDSGACESRPLISRKLLTESKQRSTRLAVLLPDDSNEYLRAEFPEYLFEAARCWAGLDRLLNSSHFDAALLDPEYGGFCDAATVLRVLSAHVQISIFGYVRLVPANLQRVLSLSKQGVEQVFVHPVKASNRRFRNAITRAASNKLSYDLLATLEAKIEALPPTVGLAVDDLFRRPDRYHAASDIAREADIPLRTLYRILKKTGLASPKNLLAAAKVVRGYVHLRQSDLTVQEVSTCLGYSRARVFAKHAKTILGRSPSTFRSDGDVDERVLQFVEWVFKPTNSITLPIIRSPSSLAEQTSVADPELAP